MKDDALRCVKCGRKRVRHRVSHGDELEVERADDATLAVAHGHELGATEQTRFLDAAASQPEREWGSVNRKRHVAEQEGQAAHVILVAVGGYAPVDAMCVLA